MDMAVAREVNKMTRSMSYSRETEMIGEPSISARDMKRRSKGERYKARVRKEGNGCCRVWGIAEVTQGRSKFNCNALHGYPWPASIHLPVAPV